MVLVLWDRQRAEFDLDCDFRNPFKTLEEKERILRILSAKRELQELRKEERRRLEERPGDVGSGESSMEASELYPVEQTEGPRRQTVNRVSDESIIAGDFEEASESSETPGGARPVHTILGERADVSDSSATTASEAEGSEVAVEIGLARLNAIRTAERREERERVESCAHTHHAPYVRRREESGASQR